MADKETHTGKDKDGNAVRIEVERGIWTAYDAKTGERLRGAAGEAELAAHGYTVDPLPADPANAADNAPPDTGDGKEGGKEEKGKASEPAAN